MTIRSILAITLFVFTYLLLISLSLALTAFCTLAGIALIAAAPRFITIVLGLGLISMGFIVLFFFDQVYLQKTQDRPISSD